MSHMGEYPAIPSALDRLDPSSRNQWGLPSRAAGPTPADLDSENEQLRRENRELRRLLHEIDQERLDLIRLAEARDRGPVRTDP